MRSLWLLLLGLLLLGALPVAPTASSGCPGERSEAACDSLQESEALAMAADEPLAVPSFNVDQTADQPAPFLNHPELHSLLMRSFGEVPKQAQQAINQAMLNIRRRAVEAFRRRREPESEPPPPRSNAPRAI